MIVSIAHPTSRAARRDGGDERRMAPGEIFRGSLLSGRAIELFRQISGGRRVSANGRHETVASLQQRVKGAGPVERPSRRRRGPRSMRGRRATSHTVSGAARHSARQREEKLRRRQRRKIIGAAAVIDIALISPHRRAAISGQRAIDRIGLGEQMLQPRQRRLDSCIQGAMGTVLPPRVNHGENDGDVELFLRGVPRPRRCG